MIGCRRRVLKVLFIFLLQVGIATLTDVDDGPDICPRDRDEAASKGRQCLRKCKNDADCISTRKRCLCDGLCGWSCVRPGL
ncbi:hypothetical protein HNY73_011945 [Argiope bruennichi]|uniref:WAP domain-containing protein n=1 Tax=Argiope bruennichi TaxID=94029 RepID=A0A8T0EZ02_ARGBR|nr:hypothetical protein HNY73_011945 [Argiope bruennichi]